MSESHEFVEHLEHVHKEHEEEEGSEEGHKKLSRLIALTIAALGALLAFLSAMVGSSRTELVATMIERQQATQRLFSVSTKYRILEAQLQQLHALLPDAALMHDADTELARIDKETTAPDARRILATIHLESSRILSTVTPTHTDLMRFAGLIRKLSEERRAAYEWDQSYLPAVEADGHAAESYERAELCVEVAIVVASVGMLLMDRRIWGVALLLGCLGIVLASYTGVGVHDQMKQAHVAIAAAEEHIHEAATEKREMDADEALLKEIEAREPASASPSPGEH